jgi:hypothetical protein
VFEPVARQGLSLSLTLSVLQYFCSKTFSQSFPFHSSELLYYLRSLLTLDVKILGFLIWTQQFRLCGPVWPLLNHCVICIHLVLLLSELGIVSTLRNIGLLWASVREAANVCFIVIHQHRLQIVTSLISELHETKNNAFKRIW